MPIVRPVSLGEGTGLRRLERVVYKAPQCSTGGSPMSLDFDSARLYNPNLTSSHEEWRTQLRRFVDAEIMPYAEDWDEAGEIPIELWPKAAAVGLLGLGYPEQYGGTPGDVWLTQIATEELSRVGVGGVNASLMVHGIGLPPVINWGSEAMKE